MSDLKEDHLVDITGFKCPVPLIKTRRAIKNANENQIIKFIGTKEEEISRKEILVALESLKQPVIDSKVTSNGNWHIFMRKKS